MMSVFNAAPRNPLRVCLAPILSIKDFVTGELNHSQAININMFLVSRAKAPDNDIVHNLVRVGREGCNITIKVDEAQYRTMPYVQRALNPLLEIGQAVYAVSKDSEEWPTRTKRIQTIPLFHDKLVLIRLKDGGKKVLIGSAGFTDNVQDNLNLENMVLIFMPEIYDNLLGHFNSINRGRLNVTKL
jgi:hypothetical protein